ncbi:MAG: class A beta-lactamase-related serine hydrolase [Rubrivivax sp.]|nr:MAG: class A beta-lactamase-related serine hydrolase [Rubrivivax sp.]
MNPPRSNRRDALRCALTLPWLLAGCGGGGESEPEVPDRDNPLLPSSGSLTEQYLATYVGALPANQPGISVLVVRAGAELYSGSRGMANGLTGTAVTRRTGFRLASVSKPFTAVAVMQLVERGQLKLSDSLLDFIPELPARWHPITIEHLLTHQSGIVDIFNDFWTPAVFAGMTLDGLIPYLTARQPTLEFEPGSRGDYSNTGYMLLAKIIERRTGRRFGDHMAENVFGPAGMAGSYINDEFQPIKAGDALNYADRTTFYGHTTYFKGSMAQVSSTDDFLHFFQAFLSGRLVSSATVAEMARRRVTLVGGANYGYGFGITSYGVNHLGEWDGFCTSISIDIARRNAWVVLTNSGSIGMGHVRELERLISVNV